MSVWPIDRASFHKSRLHYLEIAIRFISTFGRKLLGFMNLFLISLLSLAIILYSLSSIRNFEQERSHRNYWECNPCLGMICASFHLMEVWVSYWQMSYLLCYKKLINEGSGLKYNYKKWEIYVHCNSTQPFVAIQQLN